MDARTGDIHGVDIVAKNVGWMTWICAFAVAVAVTVLLNMLAK